MAAEKHQDGNISDEELVIAENHENQDIFDRFLEKIRKIPFSGIVLSAFSGLCMALASLIVKKIPSMNPVLILVTRSAIQFLFYLPIMLYYKFNIFGIIGERTALFLRSFIGFIYSALLYMSMRFIPLADASTIIYSSPIYTTILACIFLKESCSIIHIVAIIISMVGALIVSRPTFMFPRYADAANATSSVGVAIDYSNYEFKNSTTPDGEVIDRTIGIPMAFGAAMGTTLVMIMMRRMPETPSAVIVNAYSVTIFVCGIIYLVIVNYLFHDSSFASGIIVPVNSIDYAWLFCNGICGVLSQIAYTASLKIEEAGVVSLARTFQIVCAFTFQAILLKSEKIYWTSILGAILIVLSVSACAIKKIIDSRRLRQEM